ncbi:MAG: hypothetical protein A2017_04405 [Lentisphaerae bacterium GWF2_44_16]|nr:MAG: hypothetical protein A2017_04405 [Lentisphaerae bacterium GWF2_44_16]
MATNLLIRLPSVSQEVTIGRDWFVERDKLLAEAGTLKTISDEDSFKRGAGLLSGITKTSNKLEKMRRDFSRPFNDALKTIKKASDSARAPLESVKKELKSRLSFYADEQFHKYEAAQSEFMREQKECSEKQEYFKELARDEFGDSDTELFNPSFVEYDPGSVRPGAENVAIKSTLSFEIASPGEVPREFLSVDEKKIRLWLNLHRDEIKQKLKDSPECALSVIPGVKIKLETDVVSR